MTHEQFRSLIDSLGLGLTEAESLYTRLVAWFETGYGDKWPAGAGAGSNNFGALTTKRPDSLSFQHQDSSAAQGQYTAWFSGYATPEAGARALVAAVLKPNVRAALARNAWPAAVQAQYANKYFAGLHPHDGGAGDTANVNDYRSALAKASRVVTTATGEQDVSGLLLGNMIISPVRSNSSAALVTIAVLGLAAAAGYAARWRREALIRA